MKGTEQKYMYITQRFSLRVHNHVHTVHTIIHTYTHTRKGTGKDQAHPILHAKSVKVPK